MSFLNEKDIRFILQLDTLLVAIYDAKLRKYSKGIPVSACEFYGLIGGIFGLMSINTMAAIAIDRYYAIARPLQVCTTLLLYLDDHAP